MSDSQEEEIMDTNQHISLLPVAVEDIRFVKIQQWKVVYYVLLLHVAIAGFYKFSDNLELSIDGFEKNILILIALLIAVLGTWILFELQRALVKFRVRLHNIYDGISKSESDFYDVWGVVEKDKTKLYYQAPPFLISFSIIMWFGAFFVKWLLTESSGCYIWYVFGYIGLSVLLYLYSDCKLKKDFKGKGSCR